MPPSSASSPRDSASVCFPATWQCAFRRPSRHVNSSGRQCGPVETKGASMARHALGVLGVVAAGILLAVSAAMNYRFGFSLGKTALDGQIYGAASAAADCFKALVPFFLFAAIRNRMWSQAFAAALVWTVVTSYSMTSALGHAALNRLDTTGQRAVEAANYKDLRADSKRAQDQLTWIPAHRPAETVASELNVIKAQRYWVVTRECTEVSGKSCARLLPAVPQAQRGARLGPAVAEARVAHLRDRRQARQDGGRHGHGRGRSAGERAVPRSRASRSTRCRRR